MSTEGDGDQSKAVIGRSQAEDSLFLCGEMILSVFGIKPIPETKRRRQMHITAECTSETLVGDTVACHYLFLQNNALQCFYAWTCDIE